MKGYIHSLQSMGTVDGPGVRSVVFAQGCPLRCCYCHNPDTWATDSSSLIEAEELAEKIIRFYPYIKDGGVTFSGGEPLCQTEFFIELATLLKAKGLHIALDTSANFESPKEDELLALVDLVLLDIKFTTEEEYAKHTGGSLQKALGLLDKLQASQKECWIRQVIVPELNDTEESVLRLKELVGGYSVVKKIELLPFKKLCLEKYKMLGIPFPLEATPQCSPEKIAELESLL